MRRRGGRNRLCLEHREGERGQLIPQSDRLGFHAASVHIPTSDKGHDDEWVVDVPMRSFQGGA